MFGMGMGELLVIMVVALLFVGPDKLPSAARAIGKTIRDFRKHTLDLQDTIESDENLGDAMRELRSALSGNYVSRPPVRPTPLGLQQPGATPPTIDIVPHEHDGIPIVKPSGGAIAKGDLASPEPTLPSPEPVSADDDPRHG